MYNEGKHVYLRYAETFHVAGPSADLAPSNEGETIVEYYRCQGYDWLPSAASERAPLTCIDGTVVESPSTRVRVVKDLAGKSVRISEMCDERPRY